MSKITLLHDTFIEYCLEEIGRQQRIQAGIAVSEIASCVEKSLSSASKAPVIGTAVNSLILADRFCRSFYEDEQRITKVFNFFSDKQIKKILSSAILTIAETYKDLDIESDSSIRTLAASAKNKLFDFIKRNDLNGTLFSSKTIVDILQKQNIRNFENNQLEESLEPNQKKIKSSEDYVLKAVTEETCSRETMSEGASEFDDFNSDIFQIDRIEARIDRIEQRTNTNTLSLNQLQQNFHHQISGLENFYNVAEVVNCFIGREEALQQMYSYSSASEDMVQTIGGIGGIGKTQIVLKYIFLHKQEYNYRVRYFLAETRDSLDNGFREFAQAIGLAVDKKDNAEIVKAVKTALENRIDHSLLFFDNVVNYDLVKDYLPNKGARNKHHVLITTQNTKEIIDGSTYTGIKITILMPFVKDESIQYITNSITESNLEDINKLAELFEGIPLGLSQSISFIRNYNIKIKTYFAEYEKFKSNERLLTKLHDSKFDPHVNNIYITLSMTLAKLSEQKPKALELFQLFSYLNADNIPIFLTNNLLESSIEQSEAISVLEGYSLVSIKYDMIYIHRLVQDITRINIDDTDVLKKAMKLLHKHMKQDFSDIESLKKNQLLLPHITSLIYHCTKLTDKDISLTKKMAELYSDCGNIYFILLELNKSLEKHKQALRIYNLVYEKNHKKKAIAISNIGAVLQLLKRPKEAKSEYEKALSIYTALEDSQDQNIAITMIKIASCYLDLKDCSPALILYEKALDIYSKNSEILNIASTIEEIGNVYKILQKYQDALDKYNLALSLYTSIYGEKSQKIAEIINSIGDVYRRLENYPKAENHYRKAMEINIEIHSDNHLSIAINLCGICKIYQSLSRYQEALDLYEKALLILRKTFDKDHLMIGSIIYDIAYIYQKQKQYELALEYFNKALLIYKAAYGEEHVYITKIINKILLVSKELEQESLGSSLYRQISNDGSQPIFTTTLNWMTWIQYIEPSEHLISQDSTDTVTRFTSSSSNECSHQSSSSPFEDNSQSSQNLVTEYKGLKLDRDKILANLINLCADQEVDEIITDAIKEYGISHVLEIIFGFKQKSEHEIIQDIINKIDNFIGINNDKLSIKLHSDSRPNQTLTYSRISNEPVKLESLFYESSIFGYQQYRLSALSNNYFSPFAKKIIKTIGNLIEEFENWADTINSYLEINDYAQSVIEQLSYLFAFVESGENYERSFYFHPSFNPGDNGGAGYGGGGSGYNSSNHIEENILVFSLLPGELNLTSYQS